MRLFGTPAEINFNVQYTVLQLMERKIRFKYDDTRFTYWYCFQIDIYESREKNANRACPSTDTTRGDDIENSH